MSKVRDRIICGNCLPQGNTAVITGYLMVSIYLIAGGLKQGNGFSEKKAVLENTAAQGGFLKPGFG